MAASSTPTAPANEARQALATLRQDLPRLRGIQAYVLGRHPKPYMPDSAGAEYRLLAERCVTNWIPLVVDATAQALFVDNFRPHAEGGDDFDEGEQTSPYWLHWQASRMDAKQASLFRAALEYGHSFAATERDPKTGIVRTRGVSPLRCIAMFEDALRDQEPTSALEVVRWPGSNDDRPGELRYVDETYCWTYSFSYGDDNDLQLLKVEPHGAQRCPYTRLATHVDLEGNTRGLVEPLFPLQDRVNQTVFDLLVAQTYTSFEVRTVSGMAPPIKMTRDQDGNPVPRLDEAGNPIVDRMMVNAQRWLFSENPDAKFGHLPAGDLGSLILAVELAMRQLSAVAQVPPHYMLGQIANVNADGLRAAAESLTRKNMEIANGFGESIERIFRVFAEIEGLDVPEEDFGEVVWRDLSNASMSQTADALGKLSQSLKIPARGLWGEVPGVTRSKLNAWHRMWDEDREAGLLFDEFSDDLRGRMGSAESLYEVGADGVD